MSDKLKINAKIKHTLGEGIITNIEDRGKVKDPHCKIPATALKMVSINFGDFEKTFVWDFIADKIEFI